ncbi:c-type cytochrome [Legionella sp. D16C41]|uniref:c-type cytochrome n=1 Tax=Legionella sp. D16C41 TaxID=3402688 RepID=UPI003AF80547
MRIALLLLILVMKWCFADNVNDFDRQQIIERIKPIGQVKIEESPADMQKAKQSSTQTQVATKKEEPGQATYEKYCITCHQNGLAGAPKFRQADWKPRMEKKIDGLTASAIKGLNAMPPKGTCVECSEEDIKNAILYMLPRS